MCRAGGVAVVSLFMARGGSSGGGTGLALDGACEGPTAVAGGDFCARSWWEGAWSAGEFGQELAFSWSGGPEYGDFADDRAG